ncbi:MAG TPA: molybdopterin-binding protein [Polyangiaceae bacterium]|jgi:molybdenum cofactor synthesis domain-containing protein
MTEQVVRNAAALVIGNEILSGKVADANVAELAKLLRALGIRFERVVMLPDEIELLATEIASLSASYDVVFTSGGVGPTHDDVTIAAVARAFGLDLVEDPKLAALLHGVYGERITDSHLLMARVPAGSELKSSPEVEWPTPVTRNVWMLPGIPALFRLKLLTARAFLRGPEPFVSRALFLRTEEVLLKPILDGVVARHPNVEIGSYPKWFDPAYKTLITFDARDEALAHAALEDLRALVASDVVRAE